MPDLSGLVRAERLLRAQEQHYAADSVAMAIEHMDRYNEHAERVEALADDLVEDIDRALVLTANSYGERCEYGCGVALIESRARDAAEQIAECVIRRQEARDA